MIFFYWFDCLSKILDFLTIRILTFTWFCHSYTLLQFELDLG